MSLRSELERLIHVARSKQTGDELDHSIAEAVDHLAHEIEALANTAAEDAAERRVLSHAADVADWRNRR